MKLDQNNPMHWIACGAALVVIGLIIYAAADDAVQGFGTFVAVLGVVLGAVGLVILALQSSRKTRE